MLPRHQMVDQLIPASEAFVRSAAWAVVEPAEEASWIGVDGADVAGQGRFAAEGLRAAWMGADKAGGLEGRWRRVRVGGVPDLASVFMLAGVRHRSVYPPRMLKCGGGGRG
jgi:hypothetical protein